MVKLRLNHVFFVLSLEKKKKQQNKTKKKRCFNPGKKLLTQGPAFLY